MGIERKGGEREIGGRDSRTVVVTRGCAAEKEEGDQGRQPWGRKVNGSGGAGLE